MFKKMKIWQKLMLICITFSLPIGVLLFRAINGVNDDIRFNQNEIYGNEYQRPLERLLSHISEHKLMSQRYLSGDNGIKKEDISVRQSLIEKALSVLEDVDGRLKNPLKTTVDELAKRKREHYHYGILKKEWEELKSRFADLKQGEMNEKHIHLISDIRALISHIGDTSNLILDPDLDTYYLMDITLLALPQTQDRLQEALSYGEAILNRKTINLDERIKLNEYAALLKQSDMDRVRGSVQVSLNEDQNFLGVSPSLQKNIPIALEEYTKANEAFIGMIKKIANLEKVELPEYISAGTEAIKESFELWDAAADENDKLIQVRVNNYKKSRLITMFLTPLSIAVSLLFVFLIGRSITKPIKDVVDASKDIAEGYLTKRLESASEDELGEMAKSFNTFMERIHDIVKSVKETTMNVSNSAGEISAAVEEQASVIRQLSASVTEITSTMEEVSTTSTQIADNSGSVVDIASRALQNTEDGVTIVKASMTKMDEIKRDNQRSIEEILELGKKSKEITKVMEIIDNIADQTKLIAFNAAIEAASAGEAGKRFGVVAVEIRRLADNVMESTGEIKGKIEEIHEAINRLVIASERGSKTIQSGMESSSNTVAMLGEILSGARSTTDAAKQISLSTQQQKTASEQMVTALKEIDGGAKQTSASIVQINSVSRNMVELSRNLKEMVEKFKVTEEQLNQPQTRTD